MLPKCNNNDDDDNILEQKIIDNEPFYNYKL